METEFLDCFCYQTKQFYIITLPKIASSWVSDLISFYPEILDINFNKEFYGSVLRINQINLDVKKYDEVSSYNFDNVQQDWHKLINGNSDISRNFLFLLRNPVNKFISGTTQDVLYENKEVPEADPLNINSDEFLKYFVDYPNKNYLEKVKEYDKIFRRYSPHWWTIDGDYWNYPALIDVIDYWIKQKLSDFFSSGFKFREYKSEHKLSNIYLYHKILFNSNIDKNKIKILDIEKENIYDYLINQYNLSDIISNTSYKEPRNATGKVFKKLIIENIKNYSSIIEIVLREDILMYIDIYKKLYNIDLTHQDVFRQLK
jgi:hypothetical protein